MINTPLAPNPTESVQSRFSQVRSQTLNICKPLKIEDYVVQPTDEVSPPKWHLGHTTWFFETFVLVPFLKGYKLFDDSYGYVFNSYYESVGSRVIRTNRGNLTRPSVDDVLQYRAYVDDAMNMLFEEGLSGKGSEIVMLGLQHEQQHQELLIYDIKYILGNNPLFPPYHKKRSISSGTSEPVRPGSDDFIRIDEGIYEVGFKGEGFSFDNELGRHKVFLHEFQVQNRLISNGEYLEFIKAGGYSKFQFWLSDGWEWVKSNSIKAPLYWYLIDNEWCTYTLNGLNKIDMNAPVAHVSFYEADAFANWKGKRLLTEFEWEVACKTLVPSIPREANFMETGNFETAGRQSNNYQFYGDVWEWTSSAYRPYPFFKAAEGALGEYNGKFMINQMVLRGGSAATPANHIRPTYRNFYHPHLRWQYAGIRLAQDPK